MASDLTNQEELINKFNAAFYDATLNHDLLHVNNMADIDANERFLLENLDETFFTNIQDQDADNDNFLLPTSALEDADKYNQCNFYEVPRFGHCPGTDEGFSDGFASELVTPSSDCTSTFDYDEFSENFEQFNQFQFNHQEGNSWQHGSDQDQDYHDYDYGEYADGLQQENVEKVDFEHFGVLPPVNTFKQCNWEFNHFLRHQDSTSLHYHHVAEEVSSFGHVSTALTPVADQSDDSSEVFHAPQDDNLIVLNQSDALTFDTADQGQGEGRERVRTYSSDSDFDECIPRSLQCKWASCYQIYESQATLVKHIEKAHVEVKRGDEFTCFWHDCPRKTKPFNARYKLLIHMRVHSGEKPNKCPFNGCNKAFSRLENLKIHQRSHTGERPYLCQFPTCTKSFSNSSDRAKHQRTHFDTKPYACQVKNCNKKYTDPSSLRKHVKNHTPEEQLQLKSKNSLPLEEFSTLSARLTPNGAAQTEQQSQTVIKQEVKAEECAPQENPAHPAHPTGFYANYEHDYTITRLRSSFDVKQDLKNKLSEKMHRNISYK